MLERRFALVVSVEPMSHSYRHMYDWLSQRFVHPSYSREGAKLCKMSRLLGPGKCGG